MYQLNDIAIPAERQDLRCRWSVVEDEQGTHLIAHWVSEYVDTPSPDLPTTFCLENEETGMHVSIRSHFVGICHQFSLGPCESPK